MKRFLTVFSVLLFAGSMMAFAAGNPETAESGSWAPRGPGGYDDCCIEDGDLETVNLTGTLKFQLSGHPELVTDDGTYELMYPHFLDYDVDVADGDTVSVEGYLIPEPRFQDDDGNYVRVTKATIGGEEYDLSEITTGGMRGHMDRQDFMGRGQSGGRHSAPRQQQGRSQGRPQGRR